MSNSVTDEETKHGYQWAAKPLLRLGLALSPSEKGGMIENKIQSSETL
jgi:hypothetical protein